MQYAYYRRNGRRQRIDGEIGSSEFMMNYARIHQQFESAPNHRGTTHGSFDALAKMYFSSSDYAQLGQRAKQEYRYYIERFTAKHGNRPVAALTRGGVCEIRDSLRATPSAANHMVKVLRILLQFAVNRELLDRNPASGIKKLKTGDGWEAWPTKLLERANAHLTGSPRLAFLLALYTGQRKGDVLSMQWSHVDGNTAISVKQSKTGKQLWIPLHPHLKAELAKIKRKGTTIVSRRDGRQLTASGFNRMWRRQKERLRLDGVQFHGLRRNAVNALLEAGCSVPETAAITGQSYEMIEHYAQQVNQKQLASQAMNRWETVSDKPSDKLGYRRNRNDG